MLYFDDLGAIGAISDMEPEALPIEAWSTASNVRFGPYGARPVFGSIKIYDYEITASVTQSANLSVDPFSIAWVEGKDRDFWMYAGAEKVYVATAGGNNFNLTRQSATTTASIVALSPDKDYSVDHSDRWSIAVSGGQAVLASRSNTPQYWASATTSVRLRDLEWDKSAGTKWSTRTAGAVTCATIRHFREYLLALDTVENEVEFPRRLRWSHPTGENVTPQTWDENKLAYRAGYKDFESTRRRVIDCVALGAVNYVYTDSETWRMQWVGGQYEFQFSKALPFGLLNRNCVGSPPGRHLVLTEQDIILHDGISWDYVARDKWARSLFRRMNATYFKSTFMATHERESEIWICFPENGPYCDTALVWNWTTNSWHERTLGGISDASKGIINSTSGNGTYDTETGGYDTTFLSYVDAAFEASPLDHGIVAAHPSAGDIGAQLWQMDTGFADVLGGTIGVVLERQGLPIAGTKRRGNDFAIDLGAVYHINSMWPQVQATGTVEIAISIGVRDRIGDSTLWHGPVAYTVGSDRFVDFTHLRISGRFISVRFQAVTLAPWTLTRYGLDVHKGGVF